MYRDGVGMPSAESILTGAAEIANNWRWMAVAWHVLLAALLLALLAGWRPSARVLGLLLTVPVLSVSVIAWISGNPFNGTVFAVLAGGLAGAAARLSKAHVRRAAGWVVPGTMLVAFGWVYPHFLNTDSWSPYSYAAPFGLLPCPTLSVVIGVTLIFRDLDSTPWNVSLIAAGLLYGALGVFMLGVGLDVGLLTGAAMHAAAFASRTGRSVRASLREQTSRLPGDEFIAKPIETLTHAVTIEGAPRAVWPWLVQMGAGTRAGWYSYDVLDNGRHASATRIMPELQDIAIATVFPALPGVTEGFKVLAFEPYQWLVLGWMDTSGTPLVSWAFVVEGSARESTRLIVRARGAEGYRFLGMPRWLSRPIVHLVHFIMQRKQLLGIAARVESSCGATADSDSGIRLQRRV